jgi:serine/threonine protein kinase
MSTSANFLDSFKALLRHKGEQAAADALQSLPNLSRTEFLQLLSKVSLTEENEIGSEDINELLKGIPPSPKIRNDISLAASLSAQPSLGSSFYVPRPPRLAGLPNPPADQWGDFDEYRDEYDCGFRIMQQMKSCDQDELLSVKESSTRALSEGKKSNQSGTFDLPKSTGRSQASSPAFGSQAAEEDLPSFGGRPASSVRSYRYDMYGNYFCVDVSDLESGSAKKPRLTKELPSSSSLRPSSHPNLELMALPVFFEPRKTGFEPTKDLQISEGTVIAGLYKITKPLGSGSFSRTFEATEISSTKKVCLKIIKNEKDFFDQCLDEVRNLLYLHDEVKKLQISIDAVNILKMETFFYFKEHLIICTEILRDNLYEFQKYTKSLPPSNAYANYFTLSRVQSIASQLIEALSFIHKFGMIHADLKPENILFVSYEQCFVKIVDFGSAQFTTDKQSFYIQSRAYRAPEIILGLEYSTAIDIFSLGAVIFETWTGYVLLQSEKIQGLIARLLGIFGGSLPPWMMEEGKEIPKYFNPVNGELFIDEDLNYTVILPKKTSLYQRTRCEDLMFCEFLMECLQIDPYLRSSASELRRHPFLDLARFAATAEGEVGNNSI